MTPRSRLVRRCHLAVIPRAVDLVVGQCPTCRVRFAALPAHRVDVRYVLTVHARLCPGVARDGEVVWPLGR